MRLNTGLTPAVGALLAVLVAAIAGLTHAVTVLALPWHSAGDAFSRIAVLVPAGGRATLGLEGHPDLPFADPAFVTDVCRFDVDAKPFRLVVSPFAEGFVTIGFHARHGSAFYGLTVRSSDATSFDLVLDRTVADHAEARADADARTVMVTTPEPEGFVTLSTPRGDDTGRAAAQERLGRLQCRMEAASGS